MKLPLTERQQEVLEFITEFIQKNEFPPTITEIQEEVGISNPGSVYGTLSELETKEYIKRTKKHRARNIRLTETGKSLISN
jgi:repressor LexA